MCGNANAALSSKKKIAKEFRGWGLTMSPYDPFAWNIDANHNKLATLFHMDDFMMGHTGSNTLTKHIKMLDNVHGTKDKLVVTRRKNMKIWG